MNMREREREREREVVKYKFYEHNRVSDMLESCTALVTNFLASPLYHVVPSRVTRRSLRRPISTTT